MAMPSAAGEAPGKGHLRVAAVSNRGTARERNEDACGILMENAASALAIVADGVSGQEGGEVASQMAVEVTLRAYRESPASWGPMKRLHRAAQQANIEIYDRALVVTELLGMSTTLTAVVAHEGILYAAHVGDSRLYLVRDGAIVQKTKDHSLAAERTRMGLSARPKGHPDRSTLTRSVGRELIASIDRVTFPLTRDDVLLVCSDGLYNVLEDAELLDLVRAVSAGADPAGACESVIHTANERGTPDNLTVALLHVGTDTAPPPTGWRTVLDRLLGR